MQISRPEKWEEYNMSTHLQRCLAIFAVDNSLDDQTQVDSKPAGQPEQASLDQCQLLATNKLVL